MKKLWKYLLIILAFVFIKKSMGTLAAIIALLLAIAFILWNRRVIITTQIASNAYFIKHNVEKAARLYEKAYKSGEMPANCKVNYSSFCLREGDIKKAKRLLTEVINSRFSKEADKISAKHNLAVVLWREGDLNEAINMIDSVHNKAKSTSTYGTYGVLLLERAKQEDGEDVLPFMLEAYEYNEDDKTIADNLGELYYIKGEYEKAVPIYEKLVVKPLDTPVPFYNYARVLKALDKKEEAAQMLKTALEKTFTKVITITREDVEEELKSLNM